MLFICTDTLWCEICSCEKYLILHFKCINCLVPQNNLSPLSAASSGKNNEIFLAENLVILYIT